MKRRSLLDGYNSSSITKQSRRSLLDGYVPEEQLATQVQELPQVANTAPVVSNQPTISAPQKMGIVDKIKSAGKVALADHLNKEIQKRELWEQNHPVLSALQKEYDTTYASRQNNRQFLLDKLNGLNPNAQEVAKKNLKQSVRPTINLATDAALMTVAPQYVGAKNTAKAIQAANIINKTNNAKRVAKATNALKKANFAKEASQIATIGGIGGATHGLTEEADKIINNDKKLSTDLITKPLLYGTAGALTGPTFAGGNLVKNEIMRKIAPAIANNPIAKVIAEGIVGMGSATADAAVLGALEYPLGVPQEQKDAGYEMIDHIANYVKSPIPFMGALNAVAPASEVAVNAIRDKANKIKGGANPKLQEALTKLNKRSKDSLDMKQTESIAEAQKLSADESQDKAIEFYTGKKAKDIKDAQEKANQEAYEQHLQETYGVRPKTIPAEKVKTASGKTLDLPEIKVSPKQPEYVPVKKEIAFRKPNKVNNPTEPPVLNENTSTGINTPKKDLTHVNEPSGNAREKIVKLPAEDKVAEGGLGIYKQTADDTNIYANVKTNNEFNRTKLLSQGQSNKLKQIQAKYNIIENEKGNLMLVDKKTGKPISDKKLKGLRRYFQDIKEGKNAESYILDKDDFVSEASSKYEDKLSIKEEADIPTKYVVEDGDFIEFWEDYKNLLDKNGKPTASSKAKMTSKLWELKDERKINDFREKVRKQQEYEKRLAEANAPGEESMPYDDLAAEKDITDSKIKGEKVELEEVTGFTPKEKNFASNKWREILKKKGSYKSQKIANENKDKLSQEDTWNKDMFISGRLMQNKNKQQSSYDNLYEKIVSLDDTSPRIKQLMVEQLNANASKYKEIQQKTYSAKEGMKELENELIGSNNTENVYRAGNLVSKYPFLKNSKEITEHWSQSASKFYNDISEAISKGNYDKARTLFNKNKNIVLNDIRNSYDRSRAIVKDGRISYDSRSNTSSDADLGNRKANEFLNDLENAIESINKEPVKRAASFFRDDNDFIVSKNLKNNEFTVQQIHDEMHRTSGKPTVFDEIVKNGDGDIKVVITDDKHSLGRADWKNRTIYVNAKKGTNDVNEIVRHEYRHIKDSKDKFWEVLNREGVRLSKVTKDFRDKIFNGKVGDSKAYTNKTITNQDVYDNVSKKLKTNKFGIGLLDVVSYSQLKRMSDYDSIYKQIERSLNARQTTRTGIHNGRGMEFLLSLAQQRKEITGKARGGKIGIHSPELSIPTDVRLDNLKKLGITEQELESYIQDRINYAHYKEFITEDRGFRAGNNEVISMSLTDEVLDIYKNNKKLWNRYSYGNLLKNVFFKAKTNKTIKTNDTASYLLKNTDRETLKKAKFSDRQIKELQKISAQNEKDAISLGILDAEQASKRKAALGKDIKWYAPQKHNPLRGEKVTKEPDYWNDSKVGLFGNAKKEAKETVTYADIVQNTYARQTKIKALKEVSKIIKNTSKAIGKKGVEKGYVAVNQKMLNSLIYNNNTYDFFKLLTDADNLTKLDDIKKTLMKDMTEEQADWFVKLAKKNSTPDYQIPEEVLKQALSFSKELASEQFHRYFQLPKSLGKQGSLKFLGSASLAVYDTITDAFKRVALATPSFVINNRLGNIPLIAANSKNHIDTLKSFVDALKMKDSDIPVGLLDNSLNEAIQESFYKKSYTGWKEFDDFANLFNGHNIKSSEVDNIAKQGTKFLGNIGIALPNNVFNKWAKGIINLNTKFENFERKFATAVQYRNIRKDMVKKTGQSIVTTEEFIKQVKEHPELQSTVLESVQNILGNYNDFTPVEKNVIKRIVPFYSWWRTITNSTLQLAKDNPSRLAIIAWQMNNIRERDKDLKEYQKGSIRLPFKDSRNGKNLLINKEAYYMPWETLADVSGDNQIKSVTGALNPTLRTVAEGIIGKKFFGSGEITNKRYVLRKDKKTGKNYYYDTKEQKRIDSLPVSTRLGYVSKEIGKNFTPFMSNSFFKGESLVQGVANMKKNNGKFLEPDKMYDADFGGFNKGDSIPNRKSKKWAANDSSQLTKTLARTGMGLQIQYPLNKREEAELKKKQEKYKNKKKKKD